MKILLTNSVPLNGGDEALLRATYLSLKEAFPHPEITVLCSNVDLCKRYVKDIRLDSDLESIRTARTKIKEKIFYKLRLALRKIFKVNLNHKYSLVFANSDEKRIKNLYRLSDVVISSPGGFLHDFYPIKQRVEGFKLALYYKKPVILFAQSIGPFWKEESVELVNKEFKNLSAIIVREEISLKHLAACGLDNRNIYLTTDAAFLWRKLAPHLFVNKTGPVKSIALCFRNWPLVNNKIEETIDKAVELCKFLLRDQNRTLIFLSTCQGIPGYVDDSLHAISIINKIPANLRTRCEVDNTKYSPLELIETYSQYDAFIGMRLHSAILSMLGGTPAMGLGYEDKTKGIFTSLGFEKYQMSYDDPCEAWIACADNFLNEIDTIRNLLPIALDKIAAVAAESIAITKNITEKV